MLKLYQLIYHCGFFFVTLCSYCSGFDSGGSVHTGEDGHRRAVWPLHLGSHKRATLNKKIAYTLTKISLSTGPTPLVFNYQPAYYLALFVSNKHIIRHAFTQAHYVDGGWDYLGL